MKIAIWLLGVVCMVALLSQGCNATVNRNQLVPGYSLETYLAQESSAGKGKDCERIDGVYRNLGLGKKLGASTEFEVRIDALLGHTTPFPRMPDSVEFLLNWNDMTVNIVYGMPLNEVAHHKFVCIDGWIEIQQLRNGGYVGDGGSFKGWYRVVRLAKETNSDLLMNVFLIESETTGIDPKVDRGDIYSAEFHTVSL